MYVSVASQAFLCDEMTFCVPRDVQITVKVITFIVKHYARSLRVDSAIFIIRRSLDDKLQARNRE